MKIRRAEERDADRILEILRQVNNVHHDLRPDLFIKDRTKYNKEELLEIIGDDRRPIFLAEGEEGQVKGYIFCEFQSHAEDNNWPDITTLYIDDICVDDRYRRQHVGKDIYDYIIDYARDTGCYNVTLNVWENNDPARTFYESCGMTVQKTGMEKIL